MANLLEFRPSVIHGVGGFATLEITAGCPIIEYVGEVISKEEGQRQCELRNPFIFYLSPTSDLNGNVPWNPARLLNHSCEPNAEALFMDGRIWIVAGRSIRAGEEVTFDYGYELEWYEDYPCTCGARSCVGFIVAEELRAHIRSTLKDS